MVRRGARPKREPHPRRIHRATRLRAGTSLSAQRRHHRGEDEHARIRPNAVHRARAVRADAQPVGRDAHERWLERWVGERGLGRHGADGWRRRWRRIDSDSGVVLRNLRAQAHPRPHADRADRGELWEGAAIEHVLTRSVRDSAVMLDAICAPESGSPYVTAPPARPFHDEVGADPGHLRIAFTDRPLLGDRDARRLQGSVA